MAERCPADGLGGDAGGMDDTLRARLVAKIAELRERSCRPDYDCGCRESLADELEALLEAEKEQPAALETLLRGLMTGEHSSLTLSFNDAHACNYVDARTFYEEEWNKDCDTDWVSPEEREKALATNSVWACHWYPRTPVCFYRLKASSLTALLTALKEDCEG